MANCLIALGANLGDPSATLKAAIEDLQQHRSIENVQASSFLETAPVGGPSDQPIYVNAAAKLTTSLQPEELHRLLIEIEERHGRVRVQRWGQRRLDLDLILYDDLILESEKLTIPHPRMSFRRFVIQPAAEVASEMLHPLANCTIGQFWQKLEEAVPIIELTTLALPNLKKLADYLSHQSVNNLFFENTQAISLANTLPGLQQVIQQGLNQLPDYRELFEQAQQPGISFYSPLFFSWVTSLIAQKSGVASTLVSEMFMTSEKQPRVRVFWEVPFSEVEQTARFELSEEEYLQWNIELKNWFYQNVNGPLLHLRSGSVETACVELSAAVEAMC